MLIGATFVIGIAVGLAAWNHIFLPFSNPHHVVGVFPRLGFNPMNNSVRFLIFVTCPIVLIIGLYLIAGARRGNIFRISKTPLTDLKIPQGEGGCSGF